MGKRGVEFASGEFYHCYNRGVEKRRFLERRYDWTRFQFGLYVANDVRATLIGQLLRHHPRGNFSLPRAAPLADIIAYAQMPNHFHLILRERKDGGCSRLMHKHGTAYAGYFNTSRKRSGSLYQGRFQAKHLESDEYLRQAILYVLLNPADLFDPKWRQPEWDRVGELATFLKSYRYSSLPDLFEERPERQILAEDFARVVELPPTVEEMIEYLRSIPQLEGE